MRIGLFGGSFNPVHEGHINIANYAISRLNLDELIFIPCFRSVDKNNEEYASAYHRINMLLLSLPKKCSISTYEVNKKRGVESVETVRYFKNAFPKEETKLFFIIGEDNLETIDTWQDYIELSKLADIVVFRRNSGKYKISHRDVKRIIVMDNEFWDVSSKNIRSRISTRGLSRNVEDYIRNEELYGYIGYKVKSE